MIELIHNHDPRFNENNWHYWHWCYLHADAEDYNEKIRKDNNWTWCAPDLFYASEPMPTQSGEYECMLYNKKVIAVLSNQRKIDFGKINGRIACVDDIEGLRHARKIEEWM